MMTNKEKFLKWFEKEKTENGLVDVKLFPHMTNLPSPQSTEEVYGDLLFIAENSESFDTILEVSPR